jgi:hypothetical protein
MLAEGRITNLEINKDVRVNTAWDLGVSDSTAIWFIQCVGRERRLVDYYESCGVGLDHYVQVLQDKRMQHGWTYGDHYLPHDIVVKEFTSGKSRRDTLAGKGTEATMSRLQTSLMASTLFGGCSVEPGSTSIDANEVLKRFASIVASGAIASRTGPRRPFTILRPTARMLCGLSPVASMTAPG